MVCRTAENHLGTGNHGKFGGIRRLGTIAREGCPGPFSIEEEEELLLWRLAQREHLEKKHLERKVYFLLVSLSLIHISEPTRPPVASRMPSSA